MTTFTLEEREKLGWPDGQGHGGAYRVGEVATGSGWDQFTAEVHRYPRRYGPYGTHTLVLLAAS